MLRTQHLGIAVDSEARVGAEDGTLPLCFTVCLGGGNCQLVLWKDLGLSSHINLASNPMRHWAVGVGSEEAKE